MIVLDASVLIAHLESTDVHHDRATQLLLAAADEQLGASAVTVAEVLVAPIKADRLREARSVLAELDVRVIPLREDAPVRLASLRVNTRLRLPDCCVLLAAQAGQADIATFDDRLAGVAADLGHRVRSGQDGEVDEPEEPHQ